jgi:hypothetical protein
VRRLSGCGLLPSSALMKYSLASQSAQPAAPHRTARPCATGLRDRPGAGAACASFSVGQLPSASNLQSYTLLPFEAESMSCLLTEHALMRWWSVSRVCHDQPQADSTTRGCCEHVLMRYACVDPMSQAGAGGTDAATCIDHTRAYATHDPNQPQTVCSFVSRPLTVNRWCQL